MVTKVTKMKHGSEEKTNSFGSFFLFLFVYQISKIDLFKVKDGRKRNGYSFRTEGLE